MAAMVAACLGNASLAPAQDATPETEVASQLPPAPESETILDPYPVDALTFQYIEEHPDHPDLNDLYDIHIELAQTATGFIQPTAGYPAVSIRLGDIGELSSHDFYISALQKIFESIVSHLNDIDLFGVYVFPDPADISQGAQGAGQDLREIGNDSLSILIVTGIVRQTRTLAFGDRVPQEERENNPVHKRILDHSPLQPRSSDDDFDDLLRRNLLDDYLARLNRLPGRRIDAAVSAASEQDGGVVLDYLVAENKPWMIYTQISNTGTQQTDRVRERFGLIRNQLTDNDDIFSLEYVTANFDSANALVASYEAPFFDSEKLRWSLSGSWSEFTASEVGFADEDFTGSSWTFGGDLYYNIFQKKELFIDLVAGARWMNVEIDNEAVNLIGETDFFLPRVGLRLERITKTESTTATVLVEWNLGDIAGTDEDELNALGRLFTERDWTTLQWDVKHSFYLEPLLNRKAWENIETRESSTLAHEIVISFRGQYAFSDRLIPQAEQVVGGLYSVRGYPESVVAGDSVFIGSLEYRYHVPKAFAYTDEPGELFGRPFRKVPQEPYGNADWDLVLKGFIDIGQTNINDPLPFENDETLIGAGGGIEFSLLRNVSIRMDWGITLEATETGSVPTGSNRAHLVVTFIF